MKNKKINILAIILFGIALISTIVILSNTAKAVEKGYLKSWEEVVKDPSDGEIARFIAYHPNQFLFDLTKDDIFGLNEGNFRYYGADEPLDLFPNRTVNGVLVTNLMTFSHYKSAICMYLSQGSFTDEQKKEYGFTDTKPKIVNIVEIESPGRFRVDGEGATWTGAKENVKSSDWITPESQADKTTLSTLAYLLYKATLWESGTYEYNGETYWDYDGDFTVDLSSDQAVYDKSRFKRMHMIHYGSYDGETQKFTTLTAIKLAIRHVMAWHKNINTGSRGATWIFGELASDYINPVWTGGLKSGFYTNFPLGGGFDDTPKYINEAVAEAQKCDNPTYTKGETTPTINYDNKNDVAYIGPLVLTYSGATPQLEVDGISADKIKGWTSQTKAEDGTISWGTTQSIDKLPADSSNEFYIVADAKETRNLEEIKILIKLEYNTYHAKMILTAGMEKEYQNGMLYAAKLTKQHIEIDWTIDNKKTLTDLEVVKTGADESKLANVEFVIKRDNSYIQIKDSRDKAVTSVTGTITINEGNIASSTEYKLEVASQQANATKFITDSNGKITIKNLEIYSSYPTKYLYTVSEINNPNYGYGSATNASTSGSSLRLELEKTGTISVLNNKDLGNLKVEKYDEKNSNMVLPNVGFVLEITPSIKKSYAYLTLRDNGGAVIKSVTGTATINKNNTATTTEYKAEYYYTDKSYSELSATDKGKITKFITDSKGTLTVNNLEIYSQNGGNAYNYKLIEIENKNYGYDIESIESGNITLEANKTKEVEISNKSKHTKISGYVWLEKPDGKSSTYDGVYTEKTEDQKLTNLYVTENGALVQNKNATVKVEVKLRDTKTGTIIKQQPDEFSKDGLYTFTNVEVEKLADYEVVFVYDGFYYTTILAQIDKDNGSKAEEITSERQLLSDKFDTIRNDNEVVSADGTTNTVEYIKDGHTSTLSQINFSTTISATTGVTGYDLKTKYDKLKENTTIPNKGIENVNMGIVLREQPKLSINSDIYSALIEFEGYKYNYKYNGRQNYYENKNGDGIGVKFEENYTAQRYTKTIYSSDIQAAKDQNKEIKLAVTYKLQLANESKTLNILPKQIINYFDSRYEIKAIGLGIDNTTHQPIDLLTYSQAQVVEGHSEYKSTIVNFDQTIQAGQGNVKELYITFNVSRAAILDLLNQKSTYHNASEILSYASYYSEETSKADGKEFISDASAEGAVYAGIDKMSAPGNMEIVLKDHPSVAGTKILDTTNFEDDTTSAPSLLLEATEERSISGTIWEDNDANANDKESKGNGILDSGEKPIANVQVELHKVNSDGSIGEIAKYSDGQTEVKTKTDENGKYTFGYKNSRTNKYIGILPGRYVIKYIYNNQAYIVGGQNLNANDYKSTIITSGVIKEAFEGSNEKWYIVEEGKKYSDARDNINLRPEYNPNVDANATVTNSTYNNFIEIEEMNAYTPIMDIGIEFTNLDESDVLTLELVKELKNIDFGIIKRAKIDMTIEKEITGLEITAQNGANIIPKGNPSDPNEKMQYIRKLDGLITAEIETDLLQGAKLSLEYSIKVTNNSQLDYLEKEYYYYGTGGRTELISRPKQVVDYLEGSMTLDSDKNQSEWEVKTTDALRSAGYTNENVYKALKDGKYNIVTTTAFEDVTSGEEKTLKLYVTKYLAVDDDISEENHVEIIELTGKRTIEGSIPGNYNPTTETQNEKDNDKVEFVVTPPTGTNVNYTIYIMATVITILILVVGTVVIKKIVIK